MLYLIPVISSWALRTFPDVGLESKTIKNLSHGGVTMGLILLAVLTPIAISQRRKIKRLLPPAPLEEEVVKKKPCIWTILAVLGVIIGPPLGVLGEVDDMFIFLMILIITFGIVAGFVAHRVIASNSTKLYGRKGATLAILFGILEWYLWIFPAIVT